MATPQDVTGILQSQLPDEALIRLGDDIYFYDDTQSKYTRVRSPAEIINVNLIHCKCKKDKKDKDDD